MIAKRFGFTRDFLKERNTGLYCRLKKIPCGFKDRASACLLMDFPGSIPQTQDLLRITYTDQHVDCRFLR